jgi:ADP-ribosyl-[dinitrogen reductase] hydrolase
MVGATADMTVAYAGSDISRAERMLGCLLGTAVGDALLLPYEGLSAATIARRFPGPLRQRFWFGRGMVSDDTELTIFVAQAWIRSGGDCERFVRSFAWRLRWWILCLPAGMGRATLRSSLRLWCGIPPSRSGIYSAGNGAAMRSALLGVLIPHDSERRRQVVTAATLVTHSDPRAVTGALAVSEASAWSARSESLDELWLCLESCGDDEAWADCLRAVRIALDKGHDLDWLCHTLGSTRGVSGFVYHTVPAALFTWLRYRGAGGHALTALARAGGDTDTVGAIAGALIGSDSGCDAFPEAWITKIADWPLSIAYMRRLSASLADASSSPPPWFWPLYPCRSLLFFLRVLLEGWWRMVRR